MRHFSKTLYCYASWVGFAAAVVLATRLNGELATPIETFKAFVQNPPVIEELRCVQEWPAMRITNSFYLKFQTNAFLLAQSGGDRFGTKDSTLGKMNSQKFIISKFDNWHWNKRPNSLYRWTDIGDIENAENEVQHAVSAALGNIRPLVNGGVGMMEIGTIRWSNGGSFVHTNHKRLKLIGNLESDDFNRARRLTIEYSGIDHTNSKVSGTWIYEYFYSTNNLAYPHFFPTIIKASDGKLNAITYKFHDLKISNSPLPKEHFALSKDDFRDVHFEFQITNRTLVLSNHVGPNIFEGPQIVTNRSRWVVVAAFVVVSAAGLGLCFIAGRKPKNKTQIK